MTNVIRQKWIMRADLKNNSERAVYLFGDNVARVGLGGQAKEMRGEHNAIGIATKRLPSMDDEAFFSDDDFVANCRIITEDIRAAFSARSRGLIVVIPADGLGTGLSELPKRAPRTNAFLEGLLSALIDGRTPGWKGILNGGGTGTYGKG